MKTKFTLVTALIAAFVTQASAQWVDVSVSTTQPFFSIALSGNNGIIGGNSGHILYSSDAGASWRDSTYWPYSPIYSAAYASPTVAVMGTDMKVYTSANSGSTFGTPLTATGLGEVKDIVFTSATNGIALDDACRTAVTTDAGQTWTLSTHPCSAFPNMEDIDFPTATTGYVCGDNGSVYKTMDGGTTWTATSAPGSATINYKAMHFFDANTGIITGGNNVGQDSFVFAKTIDGGASWTDLRAGLVAAGISYLDRILSFTFVDQNLGYLIHDNKIYKTTNGGTTWALDYLSNTGLSSGSVYVFNKIKAGTNSVVAIGESGLIARIGVTTGIADVREAKEISVYPNPAANTITLGTFLVKNDDSYIHISDAAGRVILAGKLTTNEVDISAFSRGVYFGNAINNDGGSYSFKFVKQ